MTEQKLEIGTLVIHPRKPEWGPGRVLAIGGGGNVTVYFRDVEESKPGDAVKTISTQVVGLEVAAEQSDPMLDNLPPFKNGQFRGVKKPRLSLDHAIRAFLDANPNGFKDPRYLREERSYKMHAHEMWVAGLGDGQGEALLNDNNVAEARRRILQIESKLNLLSPYEKAAFKEALDNANAAEQFLHSLFEVVNEGTPEQDSYQRLIDAVDQLPRREGGTRVATWPVLTQFPFIACPDHHMQLKPTAVHDCAARFNFDLHYTPELNWKTYVRLLQIASILFDRLKPLGARDFIDVQSFIWVIAEV